VLADWLEERGDPRHELIRLQWQRGYRPDLDDAGRQERLVELLVGGMRPCVPTWENRFGLRFVWCPPGTFQMGSLPGEEHRNTDERRHRVTLTRGFWLADAPATRTQWQAVLGAEPPRGTSRAKQAPAENATWQECADFCRRMAEADGMPYRLPTEAEWEYACRAGTTTRYFFGDRISTDLANYDGRYHDDNGEPGVYRRRALSVRSLPPNAWGLYEVHGNLTEW
jgi:formylglycine-generating enzyme required for sulfatase activity